MVIPALLLMAAASSAAAPLPASAGVGEAASDGSEPLAVVATIPDLGDLVQTFGGDDVAVTVLVPPGSNPHSVLPKASMLLSLQRADLLVAMGLDYEHAFLPALLEKVRNPDVRPGGKGYLVLGAFVRPLEVPESLDRSQGADLHPRGNPHFNLDPVLMRALAEKVRDRLVALMPDRADAVRARWQAWDEEAARRIARWKRRMAPLQGKYLASYHRSWSYFAYRYRLQLAGEVEPKPGIAPTPSHLLEFRKELQRLGVKVLLMEPWYSRRTLGPLLQGLDLEVVELPTTCGLTEETRHYLDFMDVVVDRVASAYGVPPVEETATELVPEPAAAGVPR